MELCKLSFRFVGIDFMSTGKQLRWIWPGGSPAFPVTGKPHDLQIGISRAWESRYSAPAEQLRIQHCYISP